MLEVCQLLHNCTSVDVDVCPDCLNGPASCEPPAPQCWIQGRCLGNLLGLEPVSTKEECLELCKSTKGCNWFTIKDMGSFSYCTILHDCPKLDENCSNCISGERRCQQETNGKNLKNLIIFTHKIFILFSGITI
jgi:hypothetical protein